MKRVSCLEKWQILAACRMAALTTLQGFLRNGDTSNARRLMEEMVGRGFSADSSTFQMLSDLESRDEILSLFTSGSSQGRKLK